MGRSEDWKVTSPSVCYKYEQKGYVWPFLGKEGIEKGRGPLKQSLPGQGCLGNTQWVSLGNCWMHGSGAQMRSRNW